MQEFLILLKKLFYFSPWITIPVLFLFVISIIILIIISIIITLDSTYRPNIPQYSYNMILDYITPLIAIISPSLIILFLNPNNTSLFQKFGYILMIHIFILIPVIYFWSKHRKWEFNNMMYKLWSNPRIWLDITIAIVYPAFWGFCLFYLRYLRLGNELDLTKYINNTMLNIIIVLIFLWPFALLWFRILIQLFLQFKSFLWHEFSNLMVSIILFLLRYKIIFKILEKLYQLSFVWITFIICHPQIYRNKSYMRKKIHMLYLQPYKLWFFIFIFVFIEICYSKGHIYYSLYFIFLFLSLRAIIQILNQFNGPMNNWVELCCYSNYLSSKWMDAYYPKKFWLLFNEIRSEFHYNPPLKIEEEKRIKEVIKTWEINNNLVSKRDYYIRSRIKTNSRISFKHRLRLIYRFWSKIN